MSFLDLKNLTIHYITDDGVVRAAVNSLAVPTDCIADSDIQSFVQLRQTLEQIAQTIQSTLNALQ